MYLDLLCDLLPRSLERVCVLRGLRERLLLLDLDRRLDLLRLESDPKKKIMLEKWLHINHLHNQLTNLPVPWAGPWIPPSWPWTRAGSLLLVLLVCRNRIEKNMYRNTNSNSPPPQKKKQAVLTLIHPLPGSIAAEIRDWASRTLFMASSISLLAESTFKLAPRFKPAASGFSLKKRSH